MGLETVGQLAALSNIFGAVLARLRPPSALILGCATGNGLEAVDPAVTPRIMGVDLNPDYLEVARLRHAARLPGLTFACLDLATAPLPAGPWNLVWAGLIFEYLDPPALLAKIAAALAPQGYLLTVLQLPSVEVAGVTPTPYTSLQQLAPLLHLVDVAQFLREAAACALELRREWTVDLPGGKQFWCGLHQAPAAQAG